MRKKAKIKRGKRLSQNATEKHLSKFINMMMRDGKKAKAQKIVYGALDEASKKLKKEPDEIFMQALKNVKPSLEVKSRRVGGATYQVPMEVGSDRAVSLAFRWIKSAACLKKGSALKSLLASEFISAYKGEGSAIKKKEDVHRMAQANKAFSHYRW